MRNKAPGAKPNSIFKGQAHTRPHHETILELWLKSHGISKNKFARTLGCNGRMVDYWCAGRALPGLIYAFLIERATEGGVPAETWLGTELGKYHWMQAEKRIQKPSGSAA